MRAPLYGAAFLVVAELSFRALELRAGRPGRTRPTAGGGGRRGSRRRRVIVRLVVPAACPFTAEQGPLARSGGHRRRGRPRHCTRPRGDAVAMTVAVVRVAVARLRRRWRRARVGGAPFAARGCARWASAVIATKCAALTGSCAAAVDPARAPRKLAGLVGVGRLLVHLRARAAANVDGGDRRSMVPRGGSGGGRRRALGAGCTAQPRRLPGRDAGCARPWTPPPARRPGLRPAGQDRPARAGCRLRPGRTAVRIRVSSRQTKAELLVDGYGSGARPPGRQEVVVARLRSCIVFADGVAEPCAPIPSPRPPTERATLRGRARLRRSGGAAPTAAARRPPLSSTCSGRAWIAHVRTADRVAVVDLDEESLVALEPSAPFEAGAAGRRAPARGR